MPSDSAIDRKALPARERILLTAHDLFYREGIRATGVDKVIAASGVTKVTFYRHFPSKNDLIRAFLEYRHERWMGWFEEALRRHGALGGGGLLPLVPTLEEWFENPIYRGCAFINSVSELGGVLPDVLEISGRHKEDMRRAITALLPAFETRDAIATAAAMAVDGAIVKAQLKPPAGGKTQALQGLKTILLALEAESVPANPPPTEPPAARRAARSSKSG